VRRSAIVPFPTPFAGRGTMQFHLPAPAAADIAVYDLRGARVVQLDGTLRPAGWHAIAWDGQDRHGRPLPSGIYFVRTRLGGATHAHKLTLLR
jgi:flagellar hook assembly protein FlgD